MNRGLLFIIAMTIMCLELSSQPIDNESMHAFQERIDLSTDQNFYLAGDDMYVHVDCLIDQSPSFISKVVYLQLIDENGHTVANRMVELENGCSLFPFHLPSGLESNDYVLLAFTKWMRNFSPELFGIVPVKVVNSFAKQSLNLLNANDQKILEQEEHINHTVMHLSRQSYGVGDTIEIQFGQSLNDDLRYELLIRKRLPQTVIENTGNWRLNAKNDDLHLPDYYGLNLTGNTGIEKQQTVTLNLSNTGTVLFTETSNKGDFSFTIDGAFQEDILIISQEHDAKASIMLQEPWIEQIEFQRTYELSVDTSIIEFIKQRHVELQLENAYYKNIRRQTENKGAVFSRLDSKIYNLEEYTRFPTVEDHIVEFIPDLKVRNSSQQTMFDMPFVSTVYGVDSVLSMVNFLPHLPKKILEMDPNYFRQIELFLQPFTINGFDFKGAVNFTTYPRYNDTVLNLKNPDKFNRKLNKGMSVIMRDSLPFNVPWLGQVLYWDPHFNPSHSSTVYFKSSDSPGEYEAVLYSYNALGVKSIAGRSTFYIR